MGYAVSAATDGTEGDWNGFRDLSDSEMETLAEAIVVEVKARGPFLSMADFVNRRPDSSDPAHRAVATLQAAIDKSGLNDRFKGAGRDLSPDDILVLAGKDTLRAEPTPVRAIGSAGFLSQGALLTAFGSQITVRGDTFLIRTYGDSRDAAGNVLARAWCEAVVQRTPEFVDAAPPRSHRQPHDHELAVRQEIPHRLLPLAQVRGDLNASRKLPSLSGASRTPMIIRLATSCSLIILAMLFLPQTGHAQSVATPQKKKEGAMIRILCVQSLTGGEEEATLARKTEDGEWIEFGDLTLRSPFITLWIHVPSGLTHVVRKGNDEMVAIGSFKIAPNLDRAILIMLPDTNRNIYRMQVIDPTKLEFRKGKALIDNYSNVPALVQMGKETKTVAPGQQVVETITADGDGMCRLLIASVDKDKKIVPCYDRFVSSNPQTRKFILLFPDPNTGLRAMSLSEFGPFE